MAQLERRRLRLIIVLFAVPAALVLTSCGHPFVGGIVAGIGVLSLFLLGALSAASLEACNNACLQPARDYRIRDYRIDLDRGVPDRKLDACLSADRQPKKDILGPCLSPPMRDAGASATLAPESREQVIARLHAQGSLANDVADRLRKLRG